MPTYTSEYKAKEAFDKIRDGAADSQAFTCADIDSKMVLQTAFALLASGATPLSL